MSTGHIWARPKDKLLDIGRGRQATIEVDLTNAFVRYFGLETYSIIVNK
ncbi:MAG TPA: hypothetical protein VHF65_03000 [Nitrososphaera sp.]|nr:hypothetical protein [Nitrososphaera sp.]